MPSNPAWKLCMLQIHAVTADDVLATHLCESLMEAWEGMRHNRLVSCTGNDTYLRRDVSRFLTQSRSGSTRWLSQKKGWLEGGIFKECPTDRNSVKMET